MERHLTQRCCHVEKTAKAVFSTIVVTVNKLRGITGNTTGTTIDRFVGYKPASLLVLWGYTTFFVFGISGNTFFFGARRR